VTAVGEPILEVSDLVKSFDLRRSLLGPLRPGSRQRHLALDHVSCHLRRGEILGVAGGSGSGKTTLARCIIRLVEPDAGTVRFHGEDVLAARGAALRKIRRRIQMVFQDPYASLNPQMSVGAAIAEVGRVHKQSGAENSRQFVRDRLELVHLGGAVASRRPRDLSGGQRQRVAIARALAAGPEVLIADEAVSALDVSVQIQLLNLFLDLRQELGLSMIFVSHQLSVLAEVADRVAIIQHGAIVETGPIASVFHHPQHPYTAALLAAHPHAAPGLRVSVPND
jgi:ABC-type glutathione transport system ATPase component